MNLATEKNPGYDLILEEINALGLTSYVEELDENGFTVIPPEIACPDGLGERLLQSILDVSEKRSGVKSDINDGSTHKNLVGKLNEDIKVDYGLNTESVDENEVADDSPIGDFLRALIFEGKAGRRSYESSNSCNGNLPCRISMPSLRNECFYKRSQ